MGPGVVHLEHQSILHLLADRCVTGIVEGISVRGGDVGPKELLVEWHQVEGGRRSIVQIVKCIRRIANCCEPGSVESNIGSASGAENCRVFKEGLWRDPRACSRRSTRTHVRSEEH